MAPLAGFFSLPTELRLCIYSLLNEYPGSLRYECDIADAKPTLVWSREHSEQVGPYNPALLFKMLKVSRKIHHEIVNEIFDGKPFGEWMLANAEWTFANAALTLQGFSDISRFAKTHRHIAEHVRKIRIMDHYYAKNSVGDDDQGAMFFCLWGHYDKLHLVDYITHRCRNFRSCGCRNERIKYEQNCRSTGFRLRNIELLPDGGVPSQNG